MNFSVLRGLWPLLLLRFLLERALLGPNYLRFFNKGALGPLLLGIRAQITKILLGIRAQWAQIIRRLGLKGPILREITKIISNNGPFGPIFPCNSL